MTIPGTIPRGLNPNYRESTAVSELLSKDTDESRQSAADLDPQNSESEVAAKNLENTEIGVKSLAQEAQKTFPKERAIGRREYLLELLPFFGQKITDAIRSKNNITRDIKEQISGGLDI